MSNVAIEIKKLNKKFKLIHEPPLTFQKALHNFLRRKKNYQEILALDNINLCIKKSESLGLIGANASGKTTLLRVIADIYEPTSGAVSIKGRVAPSLELGSGFCMEFTGIENLYLYAAIFGLSRSQIKEKISRIKEFSELGDFLDVPLRQYSFGMRMRLAFSLAVNLGADILLIDEMLAVGDLAFKEKCFKKIKELKAQGVTFVLVSHNMDEISNLCERAVFLDHGQIKQDGPADEVIQGYRAFMGSK